MIFKIAFSGLVAGFVTGLFLVAAVPTITPGGGGAIAGLAALGAMLLAKRVLS